MPSKQKPGLIFAIVLFLAFGVCIVSGIIWGPQIIPVLTLDVPTDKPLPSATLVLPTLPPTILAPTALPSATLTSTPVILFPQFSKVSSDYKWLEDLATEIYSNDQLEAPGTSIFTIAMPSKSDTYLWNYGLCATTNELLEQKLETCHFTIFI